MIAKRVVVVASLVSAVASLAVVGLLIYILHL